jgi:CheY-like chemotaxis protein
MGESGRRRSDVKVLVVEDHDLMRGGICDILNHKGFATLDAASGKEALELMEAEQPDLIISDILMPDMDGYAFLERIRADARWRDIPFIVLTALGQTEDIERGQAAGVDDYLTKPFFPDTLLETVERHLPR